jgi:hypothetical protein
VRPPSSTATGSSSASRTQPAARWTPSSTTPAEDLVRLVADPAQVVSIANFGAAAAGARVTGGGDDSRPAEALELTASLLADGRLEIPVRTFPFEQAAEAYRISQSGHVRGKLVLVHP